MIDKQFVQSLSPVEVEYLASYISSLSAEKLLNDTDNHENMARNLKCCPRCGSLHYIRYGYNKGKRQKYRCKDCGAVFLSTTGTLFSRSRLTYNDWTAFIASEINGLTLVQEAVQIGKSVTTCFNMRHKLYRSIRDIIETEKLREEIKLDCTYHKINLKGTRKANMPRIAKKRGKSDKHNSPKGITPHKVCIFTAVDSKDNILAKVAGLGVEDYDKLKQFRSCFARNSIVISDSKASNSRFISLIEGKKDLIPSKKHVSRNGNHIAEINQIHSELRELNRKRRGISTRHLPDYLNWYCFLKKLRYRIEAKRRKIEAYIRIMPSRKTLKNTDICKIPMPVDLYEAYGEYHYGIYANV